MTKDEDFSLLKVQTCTLKVSIHCEGCKNEVKKLLHKIEGVYETIIDAEKQMVTVTGSVDSAVLIKKFIKAGKYAVLCSSGNNKKTNLNQKQSNPIPNPNPNKVDNKKKKKKSKNKGKSKGDETQQKAHEEDEEEDGDTGEEEEEESETQPMQQEAAVPKTGNGKQNNVGIDQKITMAELAAALKLKNPQMGPTILGGNPIGNGAGGYQVAQPYNGGPSFAGNPNFMGGVQGQQQAIPASVMMMNMNGNPRGIQQTQHMYQRGPPMVPSSYYHYTCNPHDNYYNNAPSNVDESGTSESGCSVM